MLNSSGTKMVLDSTARPLQLLVVQSTTGGESADNTGTYVENCEGAVRAPGVSYTTPLRL